MTFLLGLATGFIAAIFVSCVAVSFLARLVGSQGPSFSAEVAERLEAQREAGRQGLN